MRMPFFIELSNKKILIIGGGREGAKRAEKYSKTGAKVTVYSRSFNQKILDLSSSASVELVEGDVADEVKLEELIKSSDILMVTLESDEYNERILEMAKKYRVLVNLANDAEKTELVVPIDSSIGPFRIAVTTEGKSSMVAREALHKIIDYLSGEEELMRLADLMYNVKKIVRKSISDPTERLNIYYEVFNNNDLRTALRTNDSLRLKEILNKILRKHGLEFKEIREHEEA